MDTNAIIQAIDGFLSVVVLVWIVNVGLARLKEQQEENEALNKALLDMFKVQNDQYIAVLRDLCNGK